MADCLVLRVEDEYLSGGIVIQGEFCAWRTLLGALSCLGKSFVRATVAVYDHAGPRSGVRVFGLPGQREAGNEKQRHRPNQRKIRFHDVASHLFNFSLFDGSPTLE